MPRPLVALVVALCLAMPNLGWAQQAASPEPARPIAARPIAAAIADGGDEILGISKEKAFTIGAGVVVGALLLHVIVPADFTFFAGGVLGGFAANWWYRNGGESQVRALLRQSSEGPGGMLSQAPTTRAIALRQ